MLPAVIPASESLALNAGGFIVYYGILYALLQVPAASSGLKMFGAMRFAAFELRAVNIGQDGGQMFFLIPFLTLLADLVPAIACMGRPAIRHRMRHLLDGSLILAAFLGGAYCFSAANPSHVLFWQSFGIEDPVRFFAKSYTWTLVAFLAAGLSCVGFAENRPYSDRIALALLLDMGCIPVLYIHIKQLFSERMPHLQSELVLVACWHIPELVLLGGIAITRRCGMLSSEEEEVEVVNLHPLEADAKDNSGILEEGLFQRNQTMPV